MWNSYSRASSAREILPHDGCQCAASSKIEIFGYKDEDNGNENDNYDSKHESPFVTTQQANGTSSDDDLAAKMREEIAWQALCCLKFLFLHGIDIVGQSLLLHCLRTRLMHAVSSWCSATEWL